MSQLPISCGSAGSHPAALSLRTIDIAGAMARSSFLQLDKSFGVKSYVSSEARWSQCNAASVL
jgi:hypothetical protein